MLKQYSTLMQHKNQKFCHLQWNGMVNLGDIYVEMSWTQRNNDTYVELRNVELTEVEDRMVIPRGGKGDVGKKKTRLVMRI